MEGGRPRPPRPELPRRPFNQSLVDRLVAASTLVNPDIKVSLATTYVVVMTQIDDLKIRMCAGRISVDEVRSLAPLVNHLRRLATDLGLLKVTEDMGLQLNPLRKHQTADDFNDEADLA